MAAVLTGDLVKSTALTSSDYQHTMSALTRQCEAIKARTGCLFEIFRGDGFQFVFEKPVDAVTAMLELKLYLNSQIDGLQVNCTQALATGSDAVIKATPGTSSGKVFVESGRALDEARSGEIVVRTPLAEQQIATGIICTQLSYILNRLSKKQADLLYHYIHLGFPLHHVLAEQQQTSRQNISERLKAAGGDLLEPFIDYVTNLKDDAG